MQFLAVEMPRFFGESDWANILGMTGIVMLVVFLAYAASRWL